MFEYYDYSVYGVVVFLCVEENSEDMAEKRGLFVIWAIGDFVVIMNVDGFELWVF